MDSDPIKASTFANNANTLWSLVERNFHSSNEILNETNRQSFLNDYQKYLELLCILHSQKLLPFEQSEDNQDVTYLKRLILRHNVVTSTALLIQCPSIDTTLLCNIINLVFKPMVLLYQHPQLPELFAQAYFLMESWNGSSEKLNVKQFCEEYEPFYSSNGRLRLIVDTVLLIYHRKFDMYIEKRSKMDPSSYFSKKWSRFQVMFLAWTISIQNSLHEFNPPSDGENIEHNPFNSGTKEQDVEEEFEERLRDPIISAALIKETMEEIAKSENKAERMVKDLQEKGEQAKLLFEDPLPQIIQSTSEKSKQKKVEERRKRSRLLHGDGEGVKVSWTPDRKGASQHNSENSDSVSKRLRNNDAIRQKIQKQLKEEMVRDEGNSSDHSHEDLSLSDVGLSPVHDVAPPPFLEKKTKKARRPWDDDEIEALIDGLTRHGPTWVVILQDHGRHGRIDERLKYRNQVQLKDKARNIKLKLLREEKDLGVFQYVTG